MKDENGPWIIRITSPASQGAAARVTYFHDTYGDGEKFRLHPKIEFAYRFFSQYAAIQTAARYIESNPYSWGYVKVIRLVKKAASCA